jgi:hypothetical protein
MNPGGRSYARSRTDATDKIIGSDDEFGESVISALGKRDRFGGPSNRTDANGCSSDEEAERPRKNRVSGVSSLAYSDRSEF